MKNVLRAIFDTRVGSTKIDIGLLLMRIGAASFLLVAHGWGKFSNFSERVTKFSDPIGLGPELGFTLVVFAEFFCSIAIILGFATRLTAIPPIVAMCVAAFVAHAADPFAKQELPLLYAFIFITLIFTGPGKISIDRVIYQKLERPEIPNI